MKIVDIADEIYRELGEPTDVGIPAIAYWLRANVGKLNTAIYKQYFVDEVTLEVMCVDPNDETKFEEISIDEITILKLLYVVHYYDLQIRKNSLSYNTRSAIEVVSDGHTVRMVSPTEIGKNLYMFRKGLGDDLKQWINWYRLSRSTPRQVAGDDTEQGWPYIRPIYRRTYIP
jgi:hypothetical protein